MVKHPIDLGRITRETLDQLARAQEEGPIAPANGQLLLPAKSQDRVLQCFYTRITQGYGSTIEPAVCRASAETLLP
jgi:hypothetical protein